MAKYFEYAIIFSFIFGVFIVLNEFIFSFNYKRLLMANSHFLPEGSTTYKMAIDNKRFIRSQLSAISKRLDFIPRELVKHILFIGVCACLISQSLRSNIQSSISKIINLFPRTSKSNSIKEMAYISVIITPMIAIVYTNRLIFVPNISSSLLLNILLYLFIGFLIIPLVYIILDKLLNIYSSRLITAMYIAYYVKTISEFMTIDDVDLSSMKKFDINNFSDEVIRYLNQLGLQDRVYTEKEKSENLNAALVGWGRFERIEIYGKHDNLSDKEFESVIMHEIGHSQDYSLFKKIGVLFLIKAAEMFILLYVFRQGSQIYCDDFLSKNGSFMILCIIYFLFMSRWLLLFHKLTSQKAENASDAIAKFHGYGQELAFVLFKISVRGENAIRSTWLFNSVRSYHPTVYDRIEHLTN